MRGGEGTRGRKDEGARGRRGEKGRTQCCRFETGKKGNGETRN